AAFAETQTGEFSGPFIQEVQAGVQRPYPASAPGILVDLPNAVVGNCFRIRGAVHVTCKALAIESIKTSMVGPYPKDAFPVQMQTDDDITAQAIGVIRVMPVLFEAIILPIEINQSATIGADPDIAVRGFCKTVNIIKG